MGRGVSAEPALAVSPAGEHARGMGHDYRQSLDDLERAVRVPREQQVEEQAAHPLRAYVEPEDLDRLRLLADPAGAGRLDPRR